MVARNTTFARGSTGIANPRSINNILTSYKQFVGIIDSEAFRIFKEAGELVLAATLPHVPYQYGGLQESGTVRTVRTSKGIASDVSFGGQDNPVSPTPNTRGKDWVHYAIIVHEDAKGWSSGKYKSGSFKYLEVGAKEALPEVRDLIARELRKIRP